MDYKVVIFSPKSGTTVSAHYYCETFEDAVTKAIDWLNVVRLTTPDYRYRIKSVTECK